MVIRTRLRTLLATLGLYLMAGGITAYFGIHAYSGDRGLKAKEHIEREMTDLTEELRRLREERSDWARRVALLRSESLDPDLLEERARAMLFHTHERDLVLVRPPEPRPGAVAAAR